MCLNIATSKMEHYEYIETVGEGMYGIVMKCKHKDTGQIVAIKKFKESNEQEHIRKTAIREVKVLKQVKHENILRLLDHFRFNNTMCLVFEYMDGTVLQKIEENPCGINEEDVKKLAYQMLKGLEHCHMNNIIHRDIKPENMLVSKNGILKICDFGFARNLEGINAKYTDYVSTRWYRSPELLVGDREYGKPADIWAFGCLLAELLTGRPLFPGDSDIDQLHLIMRCFGKLSDKQVSLFRHNPIFHNLRLPYNDSSIEESLDKLLSTISQNSLEVIKMCLHCDPGKRIKCEELLQHPFFSSMQVWYETELRCLAEKDCSLTMLQVKQKKKKDKSPKKKDAPSFDEESLRKHYDTRRTSINFKGGDHPYLPNIRTPTPRFSLPYLNENLKKGDHSIAFMMGTNKHTPHLPNLNNTDNQHVTLLKGKKPRQKPRKEKKISIDSSVKVSRPSTKQEKHIHAKMPSRGSPDFFYSPKSSSLMMSHSLKSNHHHFLRVSQV